MRSLFSSAIEKTIGRPRILTDDSLCVAHNLLFAVSPSEPLGEQPAEPIGVESPPATELAALKIDQGCELVATISPQSSSSEVPKNTNASSSITNLSTA